MTGRSPGRPEGTRGSSAKSTPNAPAGVPGPDAGLPDPLRSPELAALLAVGRERGHLTQGELVEALHTVELTPDALDALLTMVHDEGIELVDDVLARPEVEGATGPAAPSANGTRPAGTPRRKDVTGKSPAAPAADGPSRKSPGSRAAKSKPSDAAGAEGAAGVGSPA